MKKLENLEKKINSLNNKLDTNIMKHKQLIEYLQSETNIGKKEIEILKQR